MMKGRLSRALRVATALAVVGSFAWSLTAVAAGESSTAWASRLVASGYVGSADEGGLAATRMGDTEGMVHVMNSLTPALGDARSKRIGMNTIIFVTRYRPIWKADKVVTAEWDARCAHVPALQDDFVKQWQDVLAKVDASSALGEMWTIGLLIDVPTMFAGSGVDSKRSAVLQERIAHLPPASVAQISDLLRIQKPWAALLVAQNDVLFTGSTLDGTRFSAAMKDIQSSVAKAEK